MYKSTEGWRLKWAPSLILVGLLALAGCANLTKPGPTSAQHSPETSPRAQQIVAPTASPQPVATSTVPVATATGTSSPEDAEALQVIESLKSADPVTDAETAWKSGEKRLLAIHTVGLNVPGVESRKMLALSQKHGLKTIAEVGDANVSPIKEQLYKVASDYATRYNQRLLSKFGEQ